MDTAKETLSEIPTDISPPAEICKPETIAAKDTQLTIDAPILATAGEAAKIDVSALIGPVPPSGADTRRLVPGFAPLAASIALAAVIGAFTGVAATSTLLQSSTAETISSREQTSALQATIAKLDGELSAIKAGLNTSQRSASTQLNRLVERLDRTEKAQAEPAAKLARITETVDRLERRQQQAAASAAAVASADPDITGSINPSKEESRPPVAEGWRLRDFYAGRAVVESRSGMLFEVGPGSTLPGLGRVDAIKRENGRVLVIARNGVITASSEPRRPPAPIPYRY